ncbi:hypothetical protein PQ459_13730 [Chryseobacterium sp. KACC 21268]|nr:hypothetical protein PQ459_13730 [Chryseobacterium sp. KACC 21268]
MVGSGAQSACVAGCSDGTMVSITCGGLCAAQDGVGVSCSTGGSKACPKVIDPQG